VDLEPDEEALVLASLDAISVMAGTDDTQLQALLAGIDTDNEGLRTLLHELAAAGPKDGLTDPDDIPEACSAIRRPSQRRAPAVSGPGRAPSWRPRTAVR
jgi:hypothetical protein